MLVDVAFISSVSAVHGGVAEAFVVHELRALETAASAAQQYWNAVGDATTSVHTEHFDENTLNRIGGLSLLNGLSTLGPQQLVNYLEKNLGHLDSLREARIAPAEISSWWKGLPQSSRQTLADSAPAVVGSLDGLPANVRGLANARSLTQAIESNRERAASGIGKGERRKLGQQGRMLSAVEQALKSGANEPQRTLLEFDERDAGRAVIVIGDLGTADYVSYLVPGMYFSVQQQIQDWTDTAALVAMEQERWLQETASSGRQMRVATIAWLGYQTPDLLNIGGLELAEVGADALEKSWAGIRASRTTHEPHLSVLAHSYGSTAALIALERQRGQIDSLALIGSPGSASQSARDLGVANDNVFVGEAEWDPIVNTAFYGSDPGAESYGATSFGVSGARDPLTGFALSGSVGHNAYFAEGSESLRNLALIGIGRGSWVTSPDAGKTQRQQGTMLAQPR